jgi:hypothetical protein
MKILIITVGTRQIGWKSKDGAIRCFGADGDRSAPSHIQELFDEIGVERGQYPVDESKPGVKPPLWSAWELGKHYFEYSQNQLLDFNNVELLLDRQIIKDYLGQDLQHIILWATEQPETVSWWYRRADTRWLAELMAAKIKLAYPKVQHC